MFDWKFGTLTDSQSSFQFSQKSNRMEENEWEAIQLPSSGSTTTTQSDEDDVIVVTIPTNFNVFPPSSHENLLPQDYQSHQPISATSSPPSSYSSSLSPSSSGVDEIELPYEPDAESTGVKARLGIFSSGVLRLAYGIRSRIGIWSIASVAAAIVMAVAYGRRWQRWRTRGQKENRDQMMLLLNQKDEKIQQLFIQIDQLNEMLSARRRVTVHRVVAECPFIDKPRLNWN